MTLESKIYTPDVLPPKLCQRSLCARRAAQPQGSQCKKTRVLLALVVKYKEKTCTSLEGEAFGSKLINFQKKLPGGGSIWLEAWNLRKKLPRGGSIWLKNTPKLTFKNS